MGKLQLLGAGLAAIAVAAAPAHAAMAPALYRPGVPAPAGKVAVTLQRVAQQVADDGSAQIILRCRIANISSAPVPASAIPDLVLVPTDPHRAETLRGSRPPLSPRRVLQPGEVVEADLYFRSAGQRFDPQAWRLRVGDAQAMIALR